MQKRRRHGAPAAQPALAGGATDSAKPLPAADWTPELYLELRTLARRQRRGAAGSGTTSIVHEAWLRLHHAQALEVTGRGRFFALAARVLRSVVIDNARREGAVRRGGDRLRLDLDPAELVSAARGPDLLALDEALGRLDKLDRRLAEVVTCRFFGGLSVAETAEALGCSPATVKRDWHLARNWLYRELEGPPGAVD